MDSQPDQPDSEALAARVAALGAQLDAARAALAAAALPGDFRQRLGHELRTPLNAIIGFAQVLASPALPTSEEQRKRFAGHILAAGRQLLTLVNQADELLRLAAPAAAGDVPLAALFAQAAGVIAPLAQARRQRLVWPDATGLQVATDRGRLLSALLAVLDNAVRYGHDGGTVRVQCHAGGDGSVDIAVSDDGPGLDPGQLAGLFQPFARIAAATGDGPGDAGGSGLGLYRARALLASLGGTLRAASTPGAGSTFTLGLPPALPAAPAVASRDAHC